jgi:solute:Na+ symporter, SSS family
MLIAFVILYLLFSISIGLYAATKVKTSTDFAVAGRSLPLHVVTATVFATWFGAETVLGISATFVKEGLGGVVSDPFGSSMCLILAGLFFAKKLYRMKLLTIGDFYHQRYNRTVEVLCSICIVISYLGWVSAQIMALGLVFDVLSGGAINKQWGMVIGAVIVLTYTLSGGMLSIAFLDFVQMIVICCGMLFIASVASGLAGGAGNVISHAAAAGKFQFFPTEPGLKPWLWFLAAWMTMMLGSIPQQDVFQRMASSKSEDVAMWGGVIGGALYFVFAFLPMFLAYSATLIDPKMVEGFLTTDSQRILPTLILSKMPLFAQIIFFGALLAAIMSCASATLLAPSVTVSENLLKPFFKDMTDKQFLWMMRTVVLIFAVIVLVNAITSNATIFQMVENAYKITLVAAFVPLVFGLYWSRANSVGALFAILAGLGTWVTLEVTKTDASLWPPQLAGLLAAIAGMIVGSLLAPKFGTLKTSHSA